jgi:hypothetical protein
VAAEERPGPAGADGERRQSPLGYSVMRFSTDSPDMANGCREVGEADLFTEG